MSRVWTKYAWIPQLPESREHVLFMPPPGRVSDEGPWYEALAQTTRDAGLTISLVHQRITGDKLLIPEQPMFRKLDAAIRAKKSPEQIVATLRNPEKWETAVEHMRRRKLPMVLYYMYTGYQAALNPEMARNLISLSYILGEGFTGPFFHKYKAFFGPVIKAHATYSSPSILEYYGRHARMMRALLALSDAQCEDEEFVADVVDEYLPPPKAKLLLARSLADVARMGRLKPQEKISWAIDYYMRLP